MKNLKSLTIIFVAAIALVASVFCANDAQAYYGSPVSHGYYGRSMGCRGGCGYGRRHHGYYGGYRHHGGYYGRRHGGWGYGRRHHGWGYGRRHGGWGYGRRHYSYRGWRGCRRCR